MRRVELAVLGIQLPILPTIVLGGLPGAPDWAVRLDRLGVDVVGSGAATDTSETLATLAAAVPHRAVTATDAGGAYVVRPGGAGPREHLIDPAEVIVAIDGPSGSDDPSDLAGSILAVARADPSAWWVAAQGLHDAAPAQVEDRLTAMVEAVRLVRLYLAKQQFD
jgi:hypothetical protein